MADEPTRGGERCAAGTRSASEDGHRERGRDAHAPRRSPRRSPHQRGAADRSGGLGEMLGGARPDRLTESSCRSARAASAARWARQAPAARRTRQTPAGQRARQLSGSRRARQALASRRGRRELAPRPGPARPPQRAASPRTVARGRACLRACARGARSAGARHRSASSQAKPGRTQSSWPCSPLHRDRWVVAATIAPVVADAVSTALPSGCWFASSTPEFGATKARREAARRHVSRFRHNLGQRKPHDDLPTSDPVVIR